jgi:hypothetical protein
MKIESKLISCLLAPRKEDNGKPLFYAVRGTLTDSDKDVHNDEFVVANLERYAIIPREEYEELKDKAWRYDELCK